MSTCVYIFIYIYIVYILKTMLKQLKKCLLAERSET